MTCSQNPSAAKPVPNPASPVTKPARSAPAPTMRISVRDTDIAVGT
jgi:hypothetical protein